MAGLLARGSSVFAWPSRRHLQWLFAGLAWPDGPTHPGGEDLAALQSRGRLRYGPPVWVGPSHSLFAPAAWQRGNHPSTDPAHASNPIVSQT